MNDLIERLEKATGVDYGLSQDIGKAVGAECYYQSAVASGPSYPHYTFSIDAALTLVPAGWVLTPGLWETREEGKPSVWMCGIHLFGDGNTVARTVGKTPAIALCIAALKARAALIPNDGKK